MSSALKKRVTQKFLKNLLKNILDLVVKHKAEDFIDLAKQYKEGVEWLEKCKNSFFLQKLPFLVHARAARMVYVDRPELPKVDFDELKRQLW